MSSDSGATEPDLCFADYEIPVVSDDELVKFMIKYACITRWTFSIPSHLSSISNFYGDEISLDDARRAMHDTALLKQLVGEKCYEHGPNYRRKKDAFYRFEYDSDSSEDIEDVDKGKKACEAAIEYYTAKLKLY